MANVKKTRFIVYRQKTILCNVADIKHFGGEKWKSGFHKSHRLLYMAIHSRREMNCIYHTGYGADFSFGAHLVLIVINLLKN